MKVVNRIVFIFSLMFASIANANVILSLDPSTQTSIAGDVVSVTVSVDGLGHFTPISLAIFDIDVLFDPDILLFNGYSLSKNLGDLDNFEAFDFSFGEVFPGYINISEISGLSAIDLINSQPGSFDLGELFFKLKAPIGNQTSELSFVYTDLIDDTGDVLDIVSLNNASITVSEPATLTLISLALLMTMLTRRKYLPKLAEKA